MAFINQRLSLIAFLFIGVGMTVLQAQNKLVVKEKTGTQSSFELKSIRKITFTADHMMVDLTDGNAVTSPLSDIRYLNFSDLTTNVSQIKKQDSRNITLYPNPVSDELTVVYQSSFQGILQIDLINMQGKITCRKSIADPEDLKKVTINVADIPKGLYMCRLSIGKTIETGKFIKN